AVLLRAGIRAVPALVRRVAVLEVPDLVGEGDVVGVRSPGDACVLARAAVHRVVRIRLLMAGGRGRFELDLLPAVGNAGGHRAGLAGRLVVDRDLEAGGGVVQVDRQLVTGVHEEVGRRIRRQ